MGRVGVGVVLVRSYPSLSPGPSGRTTVLLGVLGEGVGKGGGGSVRSGDVGLWNGINIVKDVHGHSEL